MKKFAMGIQIIKVYNIEVEAENEEEAMHKAYETRSVDIEEKGDLQNIEVDHPTIIEEI